jgi:hypothetical protein
MASMGLLRDAGGKRALALRTWKRTRFYEVPSSSQMGCVFAQNTLVCLRYPIT